MDQNYLCEACGHRWKAGNSEFDCPKCGDVEIRKTMSAEEAEKLGLVDINS